MSEPATNDLHGVSTRKEMNKLDNAQTYKLTAELDKNRAEYSALTLADATKRVRTACSFVLTEFNVKGAAKILGLTFAAAPRTPPTSPAGTIRKELDTIREELTAAVAEFRERKAQDLSAADLDAVLNGVTATVDAISARLDKCFTDMEARMTALNQRIDAVSAIQTVESSRGRSLLGGGIGPVRK